MHKVPDNYDGTTPLPNGRYEAFARLVASGLNLGEAYRRAGFKASNANSNAVGATNLAKRPEVALRLAKLEAEQIESYAEIAAESMKEVAVSREWVRDSLREVAERCMQRVPVLDKKGIPTGEWRFDSAGANRALELLGKEEGMFIERRESGKPGAFRKLTDEELQREIEEMGKADRALEEAAKVIERAKA